MVSSKTPAIAKRGVATRPKVDAIVRYLEPSDALALFCMENDPENWQYTDNSEAPYTMEHIEQFVLNSTCDLPCQGQLRYVIDLSGEVIGAVDLYDYSAAERSAWVAVLVYPARYRSLGYGHSAVSQLIERCRVDALLDTIFAEIMPENIASIALFTALGFVRSELNQNFFELKL